MTEKMLNLLLSHAEKAGVTRVITVHLEIGQLCGLEQVWIQRYFDMLGKGTPAEGARLQVKLVQPLLSCKTCGVEQPVTVIPGQQIACPGCGSTTITLTGGDGYELTGMEAEP